MLYEDDGATNDYRQGRYALTELRCEAEPGSVACMPVPQGDTAIIPDRRPLTFRIRVPTPPRQVECRDGGMLPHLPEDAAPGWWHDGNFLHVRAPGRRAAVRATR